MLCEECKVNEASYTLSVMVGDEVTTRHLCGDCMAKMNMNIASGNIKSLLSSILSAITGNDTPEEKQAEVVCPRCRTTLSQCTKTGHLGCPACYEAFHEQLQPMLLLGMRLGEGSGCPIAFQILGAACAIINDMASFDQAGIDDGYLEDIRQGDKFTVVGS